MVEALGALLDRVNKDWKNNRVLGHILRSPAIRLGVGEHHFTEDWGIFENDQANNPLLDDVPDLRKPFTSTLGLSIAPLKYPDFEGTGGLYFRLGKDDPRIALLTCAHVARPPPIYPNRGMTRTNNSQPREEFVALGNMGYNNAIKAMMGTIRDQQRSIEAWKDVLVRLGKPVEGENIKVTERRNEHLNLVAMAQKKMDEVNALHDEVTKRRTTPDQRVVGFVLHSEKIDLSVEPFNFTNDWALIELYKNKIDWSTFKGNKVYVGTLVFHIFVSISSSTTFLSCAGGNLSIAEFGNTMFPQPVDQADYQYPRDGLLQPT